MRTEKGSDIFNKTKGHTFDDVFFFGCGFVFSYKKQQIFLICFEINKVFCTIPRNQNCFQFPNGMDQVGIHRMLDSGHLYSHKIKDKKNTKASLTATTN